LAALLLSLPAYAAPAWDPTGVWQIETKDSRYKVSLCGSKKDRICARLIWLGNGGDVPENRPYLNTVIVQGAKPTNPKQWKGKVHMWGHEADATIDMLNANTFKMSGCAMFFFCREYKFYRLK
jgi:uncharacterized protein (DUF2147 family)